MIWLAIAVLIIIGLISPTVGEALFRFAVGAVLLGIVIVILVWGAADREDAQVEQRERARQAALVEATKRILPEQVRVTGAQLESQSPFRFAGRIKNLSSTHTITWVTLQVSVGDCSGAKRKPESSQGPFGVPTYHEVMVPPVAALVSCDTVGDVDERVRLDVPPGQARDFSEYLTFPNPPSFRGRMQWRYRIAEIGADVSPNPF